MSQFKKLLSDRTKIMVAGDMLKHYYHNKKDENTKAVGEALEAIKKKEPFYWKILEFLYLNNWSARKSWMEIQYCSERTFYYKRDMMLLEIYDYVFND